MKKAVYAGSFDPITKGHEWIIQESSKLFDKVIVLIAVNADKKSFFSPEERLSLVRESCKDLKNVMVDFLPKEYVVTYCQKHNVDYMVRGLRGSNDLEYETTILNVNRKINPEIQSLFLIPPQEFNHISSSMVKGLVGLSNWQSPVQDMVSPHVVSAFLNKLYSEKLKSFWPKNFKGFEEIIKRLCEPQRHYHTGQHILELLVSLDKYRPKNDQDYLKLVWACFFHDLVYDPKKSDNESLSNDQWIKFAELHSISIDTTLHVSKIILATKNHTSIAKGDDLLDLFLDLDLAILGSSPDRFDEYDKQIAQEYSFYPKKDYDLGRSQVLTKFYNEKELFRTEKLKPLEEAAKINLKRKIK